MRAARSRLRDYPGDLFDRLNRARLVVRMHYGDEYRIFFNRAAHVVDADKPARRDREISNARACLLKRLACGEHSRVLNLRSDDVIARFAMRFCYSANGEVICFSPARDKDYLVWRGID